MRIHTVKIDRETGEWISDPVSLDESTTPTEWANRVDSENYHYDTAEFRGEWIAVVCEYVG
jgi:hypothetical protein